MSKAMKYLAIFVLFFSFSSSAFSADFAERLVQKKYRKALMAGCDNIQVKSPATAAILGILPGGGSFYTGAIGLGVADAVLWMFGSTLWDSPLAWNRAKSMNRAETIFVCEMEGNKL